MASRLARSSASSSASSLACSLASGADRAWFSGPAARLRGALLSAAGVLSPVWCIGCAEQDTVLCELCAEELHLRTRRPAAAEQQALALPLRMDSPDITVLPVSAAGSYEGLLARAVLAFKDHGALGLREPLGVGFTRALRLATERAAAEVAAPSGAWLLVAPPPSLRSRLTRGYDPVPTLLGRALIGPERELRQSGMRLRHIPGLLRQSRAAALRSLNPRRGRQKTQGARARRRRTRGSMELTPRGRSLLRGADVLLIDDVLTSGSTLAELHRLLSAAGARVHGAAVLAAAPGPGAGDEFLLVGASPEA